MRVRRRKAQESMQIFQYSIFNLQVRMFENLEYQKQNWFRGLLNDG